MAHKTLIGGTAYEISGGKALVNGTAYSIKNGNTLVDGTVWVVAFGGGPVILEVEKITSDTYAGETTYTGEQFILLNIFPKTNGTVTVTYGGLTKTITDTSGAEEPNAQKVFFGTFNGVSDSVATPASGELIIEGDVRGVAANTTFNTTSKAFGYYRGVTAIVSLGNTEILPISAYVGCAKIQSVVIPGNVKVIDMSAFSKCTALAHVQIKNGVEQIGVNAFSSTDLSTIRIPASVTTMEAPFTGINKDCFVEIDSGNTSYKIDGNGIVEMATNTLVEGFLNTTIPSYVTSVGMYAFYGLTGLTNLTIPASVTDIGYGAFCECTGLTNITVLATTPPVLSGTMVFDSTTCTITVPAGCGAAYKAAENWSEYADRIVEAS